MSDWKPIARQRKGRRGLLPRLLVSSAIVLGSGVLGAAAANADPGPSGSPANPFGTLGCSCQETELTGSHAPGAEIERGVIAGAHGAATRTEPRPE
jgi:hypothetical protein